MRDKQTLKPLWLALILSMFLTMAQAVQSKSILVLGDSISAGYGMTIEESWVTLLQQRLEQDSFTVVNASISGETTAGGLARLPQLLEKYQPELVVIELGGNDGLRGYPVAKMKDNISKMIQQCQESNAEVLMLGMQIPPNYGKRYSRLFQASYESIAQQHDVKLLPFFLDKVALYKDLMQKDGIHPNASAQPQLLNNAWPLLAQLLKVEHENAIGSKKEEEEK